SVMLPASQSSPVASVAAPELAAMTPGAPDEIDESVAVNDPPNGVRFFIAVMAVPKHSSSLVTFCAHAIVVLAMAEFLPATTLPRIVVYVPSPSFRMQR